MSDPFMWTADEWEKMIKEIEDELGNGSKDWKKILECECGAHHTSFPWNHLSFCPLYKQKPRNIP